MLKTRKSVAKRFKVTGRKKLMRRAIGQDHFNAKHPGSTTRRLHKKIRVSDTDTQTIKKHIPYA